MVSVAVRPLALAATLLLLAGCSAPASGPQSGSETVTGSAAPARGAGSEVPSGSATEPAPRTDPAVIEAMESLSLEQKAGQLVWFAVQPGEDAAAAERIGSAHAGGVFLLAGGGRWDADAVAGTAASLEAASTAEATGGIGPLVAADQEGGQVQVLRGEGFTRLPSAEDQAVEHSPDEVRSLLADAGAELSRAGVDIVLGPVADVVDPELGNANEPVGMVDRGYGTDPQEVSDYVTAAVEGWRAGGVAPTLKHFPGLGGVEGNTDFTADGITDDTLTADDASLASFTAGIEAGAPLVMMSSARYPLLDGGAGEPAMFSEPIVTGLLREELGFDGIVVSDDVGAAAAVQDVPPAERGARFVAAGGDVVLTADPALTDDIAQGIAERAAADPAFAGQLDAAVLRVLALKHERGLLSD